MLVNIFVLILSYLFGVSSQLDEGARQIEYNLRNYTWPATYNPPTAGWKDLMDRRFAQISQIESASERYDGYMQTVVAAITAPNFTENGWGLTLAPQSLVDDLKDAIKKGLPNAQEERDVDVIEGLSPLFIRRGDLTSRVLKELHNIHEVWSGIKLKPSNSYGFRLYRNGSSLNMHVDKSNTHVISSILHIDHSEDSKPWPIVIEDFQGNTNEVVLESGDMLLYESSKCFHGRPTKFSGSWYTSVFTHYYPASAEWKNTDRTLESHYAVPPIWDHSPRRSYHNEYMRYQRDYDKNIGSKLQMIGTSMKEPDCVDSWCALSNSVKYFGPAISNEILTTGSKRKINLDGEL